ncbi:methyltransferase domain-containing protein [Streptomyces sp. TRM43335]|uniref:Methyltransferase domain-containing protein n=1 Tax=Streptomyces taklimakanensis TaxID=2569853 RepID=A0A6G2BIY0_9ACTN|nr:methyltransferase domain-containing protein [Streptomyces taklimakanensis]
MKVLWEEPVTAGIISESFRYTGGRSDLRVVDIGCGAAEGLRLMLPLVQASSRTLHYTGIDLDVGLLGLAREQFADRPGTSFVEGDMRYDLPEEPADVYFSCGVPYSHLAPDELTRTLANIFRTIRRNRSRSSVVVDVLGRYSLEWEPHWESAHRDYHMSFFNSKKPSSATPMSFWDSQALLACIGEAVQQAGSTFERVTFHDRSIMVGRHTSTRQYNPTLSPYRDLINRLEAGDGAIAARDLMFPSPVRQAPWPISSFHHRFAAQWDGEIARRYSGRQYLSAAGARSLARGLRAIEHRISPGLGVGHSLTAVIGLDHSV